MSADWNDNNTFNVTTTMPAFNVTVIFLLLVINALGIVFNSILIHVTIKRKELKNTTYGTAANLLLSNVVLSVVHGFCAIASLISKEWIVAEWICKLLTYTMGVWIAAISFTYTIISMNCCLLTIFKQSFYSGIHRKTLLINMIMAIWLTSLAINVPLIYYTGTLTQENYACNIRYHYSGSYYFTFIAGLVYVIPALTNILMYLRIIIYVSKNGFSNDILNQQSLNTSTRGYYSSHSNNNSSITDHSKYRERYNTLLQMDMLSIITIKAFAYLSIIHFSLILPLFAIILILSFVTSPSLLLSLSNLSFSTISLIFYLLCITSVIVQPVFRVAYDRVTADLVRKEVQYLITRKRSVNSPIQVEGANSTNSHTTNSRSFNNANIGLLQ